MPAIEGTGSRLDGAEIVLGGIVFCVLTQNGIYEEAVAPKGSAGVAASLGSTGRVYTVPEALRAVNRAAFLPLYRL